MLCSYDTFEHFVDIVRSEKVLFVLKSYSIFQLGTFHAFSCQCADRKHLPTELFQFQNKK